MGEGLLTARLTNALGRGWPSRSSAGGDSWDKPPPGRDGHLPHLGRLSTRNASGLAPQGFCSFIPG